MESMETLLAMQQLLSEEQRKRDALAVEAIKQVNIASELLVSANAENVRLREIISNLEAKLNGN